MNTPRLKWPALAMVAALSAVILTACAVDAGGYGGGVSVDVGPGYYGPCCYGDYYGGGWVGGYAVGPYRGGHGGGWNRGGGSHAFRPAPSGHAMPSIPTGGRRGGGGRR